MSHYRSMFGPSEYLAAWELAGKDVIVEIASVSAGDVVGENGRKDRKIILSFTGKERKMVCNKTNGKTIAALYGTDAKGWEGKLIALYPTTTRSKEGGMVECIRVRQQAPERKGA